MINTVGAGSNHQGGSSENATCRICLEDSQDADLEVPCNCSGSVKFAHHHCVQKWINEKGNRMCELCGHPFRGNFTEPPPRPIPSRRTQIIQGLLLSSDPESGLLVPHQRRFAEPTLSDRRAHAGVTWCVTAVLVLVGLLLIRHIIELMPNSSSSAYSKSQSDDDSMGALDETGITILLLWLFIRLLLFALPMYAVLRMMTSARTAAQRAETESELAMERELYLVWALETGLPSHASRTPQTAAAGADAAAQPRAGTAAGRVEQE